MPSADLLGTFQTPASPCNPEVLGRCVVGKGENAEKAHVCAQCGKPADGREEFCAIGDETVWLHPECQHAYVNRGRP